MTNLTESQTEQVVDAIGSIAFALDRVGDGVTESGRVDGSLNLTDAIDSLTQAIRDGFALLADALKSREACSDCQAAPEAIDGGLVRSAGAGVERVPPGRAGEPFPTVGVRSNPAPHL